MSATPTTDERMMDRALALAARGLWTTQPNPRVGCVIARGDEVVGEGWHERAGEPHAEVFALREAGDRARGATIYVTLEPCSHVGRTPPCANALIEAGVARVVVAAEDSNPLVSGGGLARLREAGIAVETGFRRDEARKLNAGFFSRMERGRPLVRLKLAASVDGRTALANGESKWITGSAARADVQRWRARSSAILTGIGTVLADDPRLTARPRRVRPGARQGDALASVTELHSRAALKSSGATRSDFVPPLRVVLDSRLRTPREAHVLDGEAPTLIVHATGVEPSDDRFDRVDRVGVDRTDGRLSLEAVLAELARRKINELQVEAGSTLSGALLAAGLVDEMLVYLAPVILGDAAKPMVALPTIDSMDRRRTLTLIERRAFGPDWRLLFVPTPETESADVHRNH